MPRYPKLLHWKAKKLGVEDYQAKAIWDYSMFNARLLGLNKEYELINDLADARLAACGAVNTLLVRSFCLDLVR